MNEKPIPLSFVLITVAVVIFLLAPVAIVILAGLNAGDHLTFPPEGFSLRWIIAFFASDLFRNAYLFSFGLSTVAALISTVIGTMAALFLSRTAWRGAPFLRIFFLTPTVLPGVVLGLALYILYVNLDQILALGITRSYAGLLIGHVLVTCPFVIAIVGAALSGFDESLEEAARALGASPLRAFFSITLPVLRSNIAAAFLFATIISFGQFEISLFLSTPDLQPLPIAMYYSLKYSFEPTAAAAGIFAIALVVVMTLVAASLLRLSKRPS